MAKGKFTKEEVIELYKFHYPIKTKRNDGALSKASPDEPIFVLRGMDETSPLIIMDWIRENMFTAPEDKLRSAFEQALIMKKFEDRRRAD